MADYREISQQYAQGAIKGSVLLNGAAAVAVLSQIADLPVGMAGSVLWSMCIWAAGTFLGAFAWVLGFGATRYVDKWNDENNDKHRVVSNQFQTAGLAAIIIALVCFLAGSLYFALGFYELYGRTTS